METRTCPECGYVHPPVAPGSCPIAQAEKQKKEMEDKGLSELYEQLNDVKNDIIKGIKDWTDGNIREFIVDLRSFIQSKLK